jgi:hypothetical protein
MVLMGMTDQDCRRSAPVERSRKQTGGAIRRVERSPSIENKALTIRMRNLDATSANLSRAAMDSKG